MNSKLTEKYLTRISYDVMETLQEAMLDKQSGWKMQKILELISLISSKIILDLTLPALELACDKHDKKIMLEKVMKSINQAVMHGFEMVGDSCYSSIKH